MACGVYSESPGGSHTFFVSIPSRYAKYIVFGLDRSGGGVQSAADLRLR